MVEALCAAGRFAGGLHRGQKQGDQHANNGDHDEKFDQGEAGTGGSGNRSIRNIAEHQCPREGEEKGEMQVPLSLAVSDSSFKPQKG